MWVPAFVIANSRLYIAKCSRMTGQSGAVVYCTYCISELVKLIGLIPHQDNKSF